MATQLPGSIFSGQSPSHIIVETMAGDGSQRLFFRLAVPGEATMVAILPPQDSPSGLKEAASAWHIGQFLRRQGVGLPELYAFDPSTGLLLCEDLGNLSLHRFVKESGRAQEIGHENYAGYDGVDRDASMLTVYRQVLTGLLQMQLVVMEAFDASWCWDTPRYDQSLMVQRESSYFLHACCRDFFGLDVDDSRLDEECRRLAAVCASAPGDYFLHRDFQSRNVMLCRERVRIIDWQGGRRGPLGYDVASLLLDPYVELSPSFQDQLILFYAGELASLTGCDPELFRRQYEVLALQRTLQILGAFAFLTQVRGKEFFRHFIPPALRSLARRLASAEGRGFPALASLVAASLDKTEDAAFRFSGMQSSPSPQLTE